MFGRGTGNHIVLAVVVISGLVAVIAIILAAVLVRKGAPSPGITITIDSGNAGGVNITETAAEEALEELDLYQGKVWTVALGYDGRALEYINEEGFIQGFTKDLISEVCRAAEMKCRLIWDKHTNCWDSQAGQHSSGGIGLLDRWYDACAGYVPTPTSIQVMDFSLPFFKKQWIYFYVLKSSNLEFDENDPVKYKIGFLDGWYSDEHCLATTGSVLPVDNIVHYDTRQQAIDGLKLDQVRALFANDPVYEEWLGDHTIEARQSLSLQCGLSGHAMMTRKDSNFNTLWNTGFQKLKDSGRFHELCEESKARHKIGYIPCVD